MGLLSAQKLIDEVPTGLQLVLLSVFIYHFSQLSSIEFLILIRGFLYNKKLIYSYIF